MRNTVRKSLGLMAAVVLVLSLPALAGAQNPNFAGNWALNQAESNLGTPPGGAGGGGRGGFGGGASATMSIKQDANKLTVTTQRAGRDGTVTDVVTEYILDGKPVTTESQRGSSTVTATWTSGKLVIKTTRPGFQGGGEMTTTATYSLAGGKLVVETVMPGMQGGAARTIKAVYDKK
jgi:hypothetical protein